jgi:hypothetical protein
MTQATKRAATNVRSRTSKPAKPAEPAALEHRSSQQKKEAMLAAYLKCGTIFHGCKGAGITRRTHYDWMKADPAYRDAFEDAAEAVADNLEAEAMRRAREGWPEPVYYQGEVCGSVRKFSDLLLIFMLKALRPDKFRERIDLKHSGKLGLEAAIAASRQLEASRG